jgi:type 1 fimbriae regulatory protein FimB/type 1 fimbriae regulatory protein FimE
MISNIVPFKPDRTTTPNRVYGKISTRPRNADVRSREYPDTLFLFSSERRGPLTPSTIRKMITRAGARAGLGFPTHPHMLRHSTGFALANKGVDTRSL